MNKISELKQICQTNKTPDDIIKAILANLSSDFISKDPIKIHSVIYKLKDNYEFQYLLSPFDFDVSGISPFSELLDQVLFRLETSCLLCTLNPRYEEYEIKTEKDLLKKSISKFNSEQQSVIQELSKQLELLIN